MNDIEKKAREYADEVLKQALFMYDKDVSEFLAENAYHAYLQGMKDTLSNQWRDAEKELPEWNKDVVVVCQVPNKSEIEYCVGHHHRGWHLEDEDLDAIGRILAWLPIPDYQPKGE